MYVVYGYMHYVSRHKNPEGSVKKKGSNGHSSCKLARVIRGNKILFRNHLITCGSNSCTMLRRITQKYQRRGWVVYKVSHLPDRQTDRGDCASSNPAIPCAAQGLVAHFPLKSARGARCLPPLFCTPLLSVPECPPCPPVTAWAASRRYNT